MIGLIAAALLVGLLRTEGWAQMTQVNLGSVFVNARLAPLWVTEQEGYFKKQGLEVKVVRIPGGTQGAQALLSGGIDISYADPTSAVSAIAAGAQLVEVMAITSIMPYYLVGAPAVKSIADLKGKRVGSSGLGLSDGWVWIPNGIKLLWLPPGPNRRELRESPQEASRGRCWLRSFAARSSSSASTSWRIYAR